MKRKTLAILLSLCLLIGILPIMGVAAELPNRSGATAGIVGQYVPATDADTLNNLLTAPETLTVGTTTTTWASKLASGSAAIAELTDGIFAHYNGTAHISRVVFGGMGGVTEAQFTYNLGRRYKVSHFLADFANDSGFWPTAVKIYVGDSLNTLYTDANLVVHTDATGLQYAYYSGVEKSGQLVGFAFSIAEAKVGQWFRMGELGIYGTVDTTLNWNDATTATVGKYIPALFADKDANLLVGLGAPTNGVGITSYNSAVDGGVDLGTILVDGEFAVAANNAGRASLWCNTNLPPQVTYNLGARYELTHFLMGSEASSGQWNTTLQIYASETLADLYTAENLVVDASGINVQNAYYAGEKVTAQYVGFKFNDALMTTGKRIRLGELGVYGTYVGPNWNGATNATVGKYIKATTADKDNNLLVGLGAPTNGVGTTSYNSAVDGGVDLGTILVDGEFAVAANNAGRATLWCNTNLPPQVTYNLGARYELTHFLMGSEASSSQWNTTLQIYASENLADLYTAENLVVDASGINVQNAFYAGEKVTAQYVGFKFNDALMTTGKRIRLGELGVYGTYAHSVKALGAQVRNESANGVTDLRFGFDLACEGVGYEDATHANDNYRRAISENATIKVDGKKYKLIDFGALMSLDEDTLLNGTEPAFGLLNDVPATNLYAVSSGVVRYTAVITNIPNTEEAKSMQIYARPYAVYLDDTNYVTVYGDVVSRNVYDCTAEALQ